MTYVYLHTLTHSVVTVGFIDSPYFATEEEGMMIFTVGVTSNHTLDRDIELSFSTDDIDIGGTFWHVCTYSVCIDIYI